MLRDWGRFVNMVKTEAAAIGRARDRRSPSLVSHHDLLRRAVLAALNVSTACFAAYGGAEKLATAKYVKRQSVSRAACVRRSFAPLPGCRVDLISVAFTSVGLPPRQCSHLSSASTSVEESLLGSESACTCPSGLLVRLLSLSPFVFSCMIRNEPGKANRKKVKRNI